MAKKDADALGKMFGDKQKLRQDAGQAARDAGGSDEFAEYFSSLSPETLNTLIEAEGELSRLGLKGKTDGGATATFL